MGSRVARRRLQTPRGWCGALARRCWFQVNVAAGEAVPALSEGLRGSCPPRTSAPGRSARRSRTAAAQPTCKVLFRRPAWVRAPLWGSCPGRSTRRPPALPGVPTRRIPVRGRWERSGAVRRRPGPQEPGSQGTPAPAPGRPSEAGGWAPSSRLAPPLPPPGAPLPCPLSVRPPRPGADRRFRTSGSDTQRLGHPTGGHTGAPSAVASGGRGGGGVLQNEPPVQAVTQEQG